jgi:hypothetical protein
MLGYRRVGRAIPLDPPGSAKRSLECWPLCVPRWKKEVPLHTPRSLRSLAVPQLPPPETERFYRIWFALLHYVNAQRHLVPAFPATWEEATQEASLPLDAVQPLRDALWAEDALREQFIADNPTGLPTADLALVTSWQHRVAGPFYIFRYLQQHTLFLSATSPAQAYGVLGLVSPIEEIVGPVLPVYAEAVLLPFGQQIIYDSLLAPYDIVFGPGIRRDLRQTYRDLLERHGVITSLPWAPRPLDLEEARAGIAARNARVLAAFRRELGHAGLTSAKAEAHGATIHNFAQSLLLGQTPPRGLLDLRPTDLSAYLRTRRDNDALISLRRFVRFLVRTERLDAERAEALRTLLR